MALPNDRLGDGILKARHHVVITQGKSEYRIYAPRRKNATKHSSPTASQSEGHNASESSSFENTPPQFEEKGSSSGSGEESGSQPADDSGDSLESASGSQENVATPPPADEAGIVGEDEKITADDTMVQYVHIHEYDPAARQQLIDCFRFMWTVDRSEDFFNNGIVNKSGSFKKRPIMPETRVVVADIKAFPDIYQIFQFYQVVRGLRLFPRKLRSKWSGPFRVTQVFQSAGIELENYKGDRFKANGQRIKAYLDVPEEVKRVEEYEPLFTNSPTGRGALHGRLHFPSSSTTAKGGYWKLP
ncbi:hypothetical protein KY290_012719 [Solanum tuberosum]|uniref:Uncharacterized protein n=1 Tax=Solanum tuberosum TaxID=4113 RepID=A0ABQ7VJT9_SOLTU|nr:hypothetical protein KY290_012719 [Solanum tuberosum]